MLLFQFPDIAERWLSENDWHNFKWWGRHPDSDAVIAKMVANGSLTPGLNYYRANVNPESWVGPPLAASPGASPHDGTVEQRRLRTHGVTDDRLGEECRGSVALRAARRTWPLDATQSTGGRKPLVARLPPQLIGKARAAIRCELSRQRNTDED